MGRLHTLREAHEAAKKRLDEVYAEDAAAAVEILKAKVPESLSQWKEKTKLFHYLTTIGGFTAEYETGTAEDRSFLKELGFTNLRTFTKALQTLKKAWAGEVGIWITHQSGRHITVTFSAI